MSRLAHDLVARWPVAITMMICLATLACGGPGGLAIDPEAWTTPAAPVSRWPDLASSGEALYLSWIEGEDEETASVRFAVLRGREWSEPRIVVENAPLFVNWADFPSLLVHDDGRLSAHWLERRRGHSWGYGVRFASSTDGGVRWTAPARPHDDEAPAEHGFVSMLARPGAGVDLVWLDGRQMATAGGTMQLRAAEWDGTAFVRETVIDRDVCSCCQTDAVRTADGMLVAYRDHREGEIRDISLIRRRGDRWDAPRLLHHDGWKIGGCPVNGPAMAASGERIGVAWFTSADSEPRVQVAFSEDGGETFSAPLRIDEGDPLGRVAVSWIDGERFAVTWLEKIEGGAHVLLRPVTVAERFPGGIRVLGNASPSRDSGFPRMVRRDDQLFVAWTDGRPPRVRLISLRF